MTEMCCCDPPWSMHRDFSGAIAVLGTGVGVTLYVYNLDGSLRWQAEVIRHAAGVNQGVIGICFGADQDVWVGQYDTISFGVRNHYLYRYDRAGTFISETVTAAFQPAVLRGLRSNRLGQVVVNVAGSVTHAQIIGGAACVATGSSQSFGPVAIDNHGDVYAVGTGEFGNSCTVYRWDNAGTLLEEYALGIAQPYAARLDVSPDGSYLWLVTDTNSGGLALEVERLIAIPGGAVTVTGTGLGTIVALGAIRLAPWGQQIYMTAGLDCDANYAGPTRVIMQSAALNVGGGGVSLAVTPSTPILGSAVSID